MTRIIFVAVGLGLLSLTFVAADVPQLINYQGRLTNAVGSPIDTTVDITFTIYADDGGSTQVWQELHEGVVVADGLFTVAFGSNVALSSAVIDGSVRWLGTRDGGNACILAMLRKPDRFRVVVVLVLAGEHWIHLTPREITGYATPYDMGTVVTAEAAIIDAGL